MNRQLATRVQPSAAPRRAVRFLAGALLLVFASTFPQLGAWGQEEQNEESMAAYADAANFQTGGAIDLAIDAWKTFLKDYPQHPMSAEASHYLGVCYMQQSQPDYVAASGAFEQALKKKQYDLREESLANHGWCLYASSGEGEQRDQKRLARAIEVYETLRREKPKSRFLDRALFYSGEAAYGLGQPKRAVEFYDQLISMPSLKNSTLQCDALYARGVSYEELDQFDKAFASYQQLLDSCDRRELVTDVHLRSGDLLILQQKFADSIASFAAAYESAESDEDRAYALFRQAFALVQSGRPGDAAKKYDQLLAEFPDSSYAADAVLASAQSSYRSGDIEQAAKRFRKVLEQNNLLAATEAAHWLARIEITRGRHAEAAKIVRGQLQRGVEGGFAMDLRLDLAEALSMNPETVEESLVLFEKAYRDAPGDPLAPRALYNAAFSALQINQPQRSLELALEFITKFPKDTLVPDIKFVAAEGQLLTGKVKDAADTYTHLLASTSKDNLQRPVWLLRAGATCNSAQRYDNTIKILGEDLNLLSDPSQKAEAHLLIGQAHLRLSRPKEALEALERSRQADSNWARSGEATLLAGQAKMMLGDTDGATSTWTQLVKTSPDSRMADQARYKLAQIASDEGKFDQAVVHYDEILQSGRDPGLVPYALYGKGWSLMQLQKYTPALGVLDQMLNEYKQHPLRNDATLARGITLRHLGQLDKAATDLETFLAIPPKGTNLGHALYELALVDQKSKQPGKAAEKLERLVRDVPDYPAMDKVLYELGWSLQESGDDDAAAKHFTTLISKFPDTDLVAEAAYFVGQQHYAAKRWKPAGEQFAVAANKARDPKLAEKAHYRLGWSHFKAGDFESASRAFADQASRHPDGELGFDAHMMVGESHFKRSDFKSALAAYTTARDLIRRNDDDSKSIRDAAERQIRELVLLHGGQSAAQLESWDAAIGWYDELRQRFPASNYLPQVFYETGFAHQQKGDKSEALKFYGEVADNYRNALAARSRFMMGEIYFSDREFDKAIPEFQRVMFGFGAEKAPDRIKNWQAKSGFEAGRCSELLMQSAPTAEGREKARKYAKDFYQFVVDKHPQHELAQKSRERFEALKQ